MYAWICIRTVTRRRGSRSGSDTTTARGECYSIAHGPIVAGLFLMTRTGSDKLVGSRSSDSTVEHVADTERLLIHRGVWHA